MPRRHDDLLRDARRPVDRRDPGRRDGRRHGRARSARRPERRVGRRRLLRGDALQPGDAADRAGVRVNASSASRHPYRRDRCARRGSGTGATRRPAPTSQIDAGDVVAVLGPNGSGKSTLIKGMLGLVDVLGGTVEWFGRPLQMADRSTIGYVPQRQSAAGPIPVTVDELVRSGRLAANGWWRRSRSGDRRAVDAAIDVVGLTEQRQPAGQPAVRRPAAACPGRPRAGGRSAGAHPRRAARRRRRGEPGGARRHAARARRGRHDDRDRPPRARADPTTRHTRRRDDRRCGRVRRAARRRSPTRCCTTTTPTMPTAASTRAPATSDCSEGGCSADDRGNDRAIEVLQYDFMRRALLAAVLDRAQRTRRRHLPGAAPAAR